MNRGLADSLYRQEVHRIIEKNGGCPILIYPSVIRWNHPLFQRPHHMLREMARQGVMVFFCTPEPDNDGVIGFKQIFPHFYLCQSMSCLSSLKYEPVWIWIGWTAARPVLSFFEKAHSIYELIDELKLFAFYCKQMEIDHRWLLETSDIVMASADRLRDEMSCVRKDVLLVTNGVALEDFMPDQKGHIPVDMKDILSRGKAVVGYYGAISPWLDYGLIRAVSQILPDMEFVFIGPDYEGASAHFPAAHNVHWLGPKPYNDLKYYLACFDVATIPFRIDQVTHAVSPLKLFEYMAGGKPVVASDLMELQKYSEVLRAGTPSEWADKILEAIRLGKSPEVAGSLRRTAEKNSWRRKVEQVLASMSKANLI